MLFSLRLFCIARFRLRKKSSYKQDQRAGQLSQGCTGKGKAKFSSEGLVLLWSLLLTVPTLELGGFELMAVSTATERPDIRYASERIRKTSVKMEKQTNKMSGWRKEDGCENVSE